MADRLVTIRKLLAHQREDRRRAAAIVLGELRVKDARSINALVKALQDEDPLVRQHCLEALGEARAADAVEQVAKLLVDPDTHVRAAATATLIRVGEQAVPALQQLMEGPAKLKRAAADVLSRFESGAGVEMLVDTLDGADASVLERARRALREQSQELTAAQLRSLRKRIEQRLGEARHGGQDTLAAALLQLLGDINDETVITRLLLETGPEVPAQVRKVALGACTGALVQTRGRRKEAAIEQLLGYLGEDDEDGVTRPILRALKDVEVPRQHLALLEKLLDAPSAGVRAFVLTQLGRFATPESVSILLTQLCEGSPPVRAAAKEALADIPESGPLLARALADVEDTARRREIAELLRIHKNALSREDTRALCVQVLDALEVEKEGAKDMADMVSRVFPDAFMEQVRHTVRRRRKGKKVAEAWSLLHSLRQSPAFGEEERYQLALLGLLKNADGPSRPGKSTDRVFVPFAELLRAGFPIETRLRKERLIQLKDLYTLGFAFAESRDEDEREFGREMLEEVEEREPESKLGLAAKNKLKLTDR